MSLFKPSPGKGLWDRNPYETKCRGVYLPRAWQQSFYRSTRSILSGITRIEEYVPFRFSRILSSRGQVVTVSGIWPEFYDGVARFYIIEPCREWFKRHSCAMPSRGRFSASPFLFPSVTPLIPQACSPANKSLLLSSRGRSARPLCVTANSAARTNKRNRARAIR